MLQMGIKERSELQGELDSLKEENEQMEDKLVVEHGLSREKVCSRASWQVRALSAAYRCVGNAVIAIISQVEEVGTSLMAINNLAEQCYLAARGPLQNMTVLSKMDMVKVQHQVNIPEWSSVALTIVEIISGVHYWQSRDREEGQETDGVGVCGDQRDSSNRQEKGEGVLKKQQ